MSEKRKYRTFTPKPVNRTRVRTLPRRWTLQRTLPLRRCEAPCYNEWIASAELSSPALTSTGSPPLTVGGPRRRSITYAAVGVYVVAPVVAIFVAGLSTKKVVFAWVLLGLLAAGVVNSKQRVRDLIRDWVPLCVVLATYPQLRALGTHTGIAPHVMPQLRFDRWLFGGHVPTVWLQQHFLDPSHLKWWDYALCTVYASHFIAPIAIACVLWVRNRARCRAYLVRIVALSYAAFATYIIFPAVPPWLASKQGHLAATVRTQGIVWQNLGIKQAQSMVDGGSKLVNDVAAVPSLHAAFPALICLFFWPRANRWMRAFLVAYVFAMGLALVYGAEHWVFDVVLGWLYAAVVMVVAAWVARRRAARAQRSVVTVDDELDLAQLEQNQAAETFEPEPTVQI